MVENHGRYFYKVLLLNFFIILLKFNYVMCFWDYAVSTKGKIIFYDENWREVLATPHQFKEISAMAYNEVEDVIYFNDMSNQEVSVFSIKVDRNDTLVIESLVRKNPQEQEQIMGMTYDFYDNVLYYTDYNQENIIAVKFPGDEATPELYEKLERKLFHEAPGEPRAITLDVCRRNLYFSNTQSKKPSIERISLKSDTVKPEVIVDEEKKYSAGGLTFDYSNSRLYWGDDRRGSLYTIDSTDLDGKDYLLHLQGDGSPMSVATDENFIYWSDSVSKSIKRIPKDKESKKHVAETVVKYDNWPKQIIVRKNLLLSAKYAATECPEVMKKLRGKLVEKETTVRENSKRDVKLCLNGGKFSQKSQKCVCADEFEGEFCELNLCHNFCLHEGSCFFDIVTRSPKCKCASGFKGDRCEVEICPKNFCMNHGVCRPDQYGNPKCSCLDDEFVGDRCEKDVQFVCMKYCQDGIVDEFLDLDALCGNCSHHQKYETLYQMDQMCSNSNRNLTYMVIAACCTVSLIIFLLIIVYVHRINKPLRPKIKKKYVVHKNLEPMSCRPTTEQCEIIIEDCCNMNICDTPCFDPKTLQQEISEAKITHTSSKRCKEDKKELLKDMDGDIY